MKEGICLINVPQNHMQMGLMLHHTFIQDNTWFLRAADNVTASESHTHTPEPDNVKLQ